MAGVCDFAEHQCSGGSYLLPTIMKKTRTHALNNTLSQYLLKEIRTATPAFVSSIKVAKLGAPHGIKNATSSILQHFNKSS